MDFLSRQKYSWLNSDTKGKKRQNDCRNENWITKHLRLNILKQFIRRMGRKTDKQLSEWK